ncbi:MAG: carbonic anhydrase [Dehalococcoidia bacterium]
MIGHVLYARTACSALVITCSDFRFKGVERMFCQEAGLTDDYDLIAKPGAIRSLVSPRTPAARQAMAADIEILWTLHGFGRVLMVQHLSCRAYDDLVAGGGERDVHLRHLDEAAAVIAGICRGVTVEGYLAACVDGVLQVKGAGNFARGPRRE